MSISGNNDEKMIDYISELPDAILSSILSFLPTRNAVQTSILSKRWKYVWTQVHVIDFPDAFSSLLASRSPEKLKIYNDFMVRFFLLNNVNCLKHFTIKQFIVTNDTLEAVKSWLDVLRWRQYCELNMNLLGDLVPLPLPNEFLSSHRLVVLNLDGFCIEDSEESFHLPNLKSINFGYKMVFTSDHFLKRLLLGCPVLKNLYIMRGCGLGHIYVESLTLMSLEISSLQAKRSHDSAICITIKAPNLKYLTLFDAYAHYDIDELNLLSEANICIYQSYDLPQGLDDNLVQLIKKVSWTKTLLLGIYDLSRFIDVLPKYENLTELSFADDGCAYELLQRAPKLKCLDLDTGGVGLVGKFLDCDVPECFSCLEKVELFCRCLEDDISVAQYFLKNGSTLKEMIVRLCDFSVEYCRNLHQVLRDSTTLSPSCQVKVHLHKDGSYVVVE